MSRSQQNLTVPVTCSKVSSRAKTTASLDCRGSVIYDSDRVNNQLIMNVLL